MSGLSRGREKACAELLKANGWAVERAQTSGRMIGPGKWMAHRQDLWGCLDVGALSIERGFLGIQVTTQGSHGNTASERRTKVEAMLSAHAGPHIALQVWAYSTGAGWDWIVWEWDHNGKEWARLGFLNNDGSVRAAQNEWSRTRLEQILPHVKQRTFA